MVHLSSLWWRDREPTYIAFDTTTEATEIRVHLHGKVNFVDEVSAAQLAAARRIVLEGNPMGTLVLNVAAPAGHAASGTPLTIGQLEVVYQPRAAEQGGSQPPRARPGFGRVVLNFHDAVALDLSGISAGNAPDVAGGEVPATHVSILAPFAAVTLEAGEVKGNVIGRTVASKGGHLAQPFGTPALRLRVPGPVPPRGPWTSTGARRTACLWHNL